MIRESIAERGFGAEQGFRWRGNEISRIEGFSDAVFAFAVTLLVVSLEVPKTFGELLDTMRGFTAFAICFALLAWVWYYHYIFFRRYGLQDFYTIALNMVLLFVVLFYVYPLKFVFTLFINQVLGFSTTVELPGGPTPMIEQAQTPLLFVIYGAGYIAVFLVFALLYLHAYRKRDELGLSRLEAYDTVTSFQGLLLDCAVGLLSIVVAIAGGPDSTAWAGLVYFLLGVERTIHGFARGRRRRALERPAPPARRHG
jgi:uncharacterized membrane protein